MWLRRFSSATPRQAVSHTKWKINHYIDTGEVKRLSEAQYARRKQKPRFQPTTGLSLPKTLQLLRAKYDSVQLTDSDGAPVNLYKLTPQQLHVNNSGSKRVFSALSQYRRIARARLDDQVLMALLGVTKASISDSFFVARDVTRLLEIDQDPARALELCRLAKDRSTVGMNAVVEWCLRRGDLARAKKTMATRRKWGVPFNETTAVIYFSGIADCHQWGRVSDETAQDVVELLHHPKTPRSIEAFNAALKVLVKNYSENQKRAWALFDSLPELRLYPDSHTFTILLQGCKSLYTEQMVRISQNQNLSAGARSAQLYEKHAQLVLVASTVLDRALAAATPPVPPTKEEAEEDPQRLATYKAETRFPLVDIDRHLAVMFLSCLANPAAGTAWSLKTGPHYAYVQQVLVYLQAWVPEIRQIVAFIKNGDLGCDGRAVSAEPFVVDPEIKRKTDARLHSAKIPAESDPNEVVEQKTAMEINPMTLFPPSPFSNNKTSAIFSRIEKPLVDFARVKSADLHKEHRANAEAVKNKKAKPQTRTSLSREPHGINKFLLRLFIESLARLGLHREVYLAIWYSVNKWGGVPLDLAQIRPENLEPCALPRDSYPKITTLPQKTAVVAKPRTVSTNIIDIALVEDFLFKMEETFPQNIETTALACELVAAFSNKQIVQTRELWARPNTYNAVFSMLNRDIYSYNDHNRAEGLRNSRKKGQQDNTAKSSLTAAQLHKLLDSLHTLVCSIFVRFECATMDSALVSSYNSLINRIYTTTWSDAPESHRQSVSIHTKIIRSGILMWRPRVLIDGRKKETYSELILRSMEFVYGKLKERTDLNKEEKVLMVTLRSIFQLGSEDEAKFESLRMKLYRVCGECK